MPWGAGRQRRDFITLTLESRGAIVGVSVLAGSIKSSSMPESMTCFPNLSPETSPAEVCYRLGAHKYPEIRWSWPEFSQAWQRMNEGELDAMPTEDDYVRLACLENCAGATQVLDREYIEPLRSSISRFCVTHDAMDATLQEVRRKLLLSPAPRLAAYRRSGNFRAWLKVVAVRTAIDVARSLGVKAQQHVQLHDHLEALTIGPEERYLKEEWRTVIRESLSAALKRLPQQQRFALRMNVVAGWNIDQIGRTLSVHRATAARWLVTAKEQLSKFMREEVANRLGPMSREVESVLLEMPSRLDVSLSELFATTGVFAVE